MSIVNCFVSLSSKSQNDMPLIHNKNLKTYFSIGEVAKMFDVSESLLRFWETEFPSIQPQKGLRNIRQYTAETIDEINIVYNLVKVRGMKISAARELIEKNQAVLQSLALSPSIVEYVKSPNEEQHELIVKLLDDTNAIFNDMNLMALTGGDGQQLIRTDREKCVNLNLILIKL